MPSLGLCNPVPVAYWSHTLQTYDHFGPQGEGTGAIEAALLLIVTVRLFPPSLPPVVLCSALLY